jgi:hypothetical protein
MIVKSKHGRMGAKRAWRRSGQSLVFLLCGTGSREQGALVYDLGLLTT